MSVIPAGLYQAKIMFSIGLIGFGYWGRKWARLVSAHPQTQLTAICDTQLVHDEHYDCVYYHDLDEFFKQNSFDAVIVATPAGSHEKIIFRCLMEDCHVLFEKPLALTREAAMKLMREAQRLQLTLMPDHTYLYSPVIDYLYKQRKFIREALSLRMNWGIFRQDVNVAWDLAMHDISIFNYIFGEIPQAVMASGHHLYQDEQFSSSCISLFYSDNRNADIRVSWVSPEKIRYMSLSFNESGQSIIWDDVKSPSTLKLLDKIIIHDNQGYEDQSIEINISLPEIEPLQALLSDFIYGIEFGTHPKANVQDHIHCLRILEAIDESIARSKTVFIT